MGSRLTAFPARPIADAIFGYQLGNNWNPTNLQLIADGGGRLVRTQFGWNTTENYTTGVLSLSASQQAGLDACASLGIKPCVVAGYGPPWANIATLTLTEEAPIGATVLSVSGSLALVDPPFCHVMRTNSQQITLNKWAYYGTLIASVNVGAGTITLAAATNMVLAIGVTLRVNRLRYASLTDDSPNNPSALAFVRYAKFLAQKIADAGAEGYVCMWNEHPWGHDFWPDRKSFYDSPPPEFVTGRFKGPLMAALNEDLPDGVSFINGASDKSGNSGLVPQGILIAETSTAETLAFSHDGIHPYTDNPEGFGWDPLESSGLNFAPIDPATAAGNFKGMAFQNAAFRAANGFGPKLIASECGTNIIGNDSRSATYHLRRILSQWGMDVQGIIYSLNDGSVYDVAPGLEPKQAFYAMQRLADLLGRVEQTEAATPSSLPTLLGWRYNDLTPITVGIYGDRGHAAIFAWVKTLSDGVGWENVANSGPRMLQLNRPEGVQIAEAIRVRTGETILPTLGATTITVDIDDDPIAIRLEPAA